MMYMCLHAEAIMDLMELSDSNQIQFKQVQGDFHRLQGKWILQSVDQQEVRPDRSVGHCLKQGLGWTPGAPASQEHPVQPKVAGCERSFVCGALR